MKHPSIYGFLCAFTSASPTPAEPQLSLAVPSVLDYINLPSEHFLLHLDTTKRYKDSEQRYKTNNVCKCTFCSRAKQPRHRADEVQEHEHMRPEPTCFGHLQSDWLDFGPTLKVIGGMRYSLLVRDRFTKALGCLGSQTRKAEHVVKLYQRFASNRPVFTSYTDGGRESCHGQTSSLVGSSLLRRHTDRRRIRLNDLFS